VKGFDFFATSDRSSIVDGSTAQRIAPPRLNVFSVLYDARNRGIAARMLEHLGAKFFVGLRVAIDERDAF
jgi:hypothetical protein